MVNVLTQSVLTHLQTRLPIILQTATNEAVNTQLTTPPPPLLQPTLDQSQVPTSLTVDASLLDLSSTKTKPVSAEDLALPTTV